MKNKLIFIFSTLLILIGCGKKYTITPDSLPVAYVNQKYTQTIKISGGKVSNTHFKLITNFPEDMGIKFNKANDFDGYNSIQIQGVPKYRGNFSIKIKAYFYGGGNSKIDKQYTFIVQ